VDTYDADFVRDSVNNVEQVKVTVPETGNWTIEVVGTKVPGNGVDGTTTQPFALVLSAVSCAVPATAPGGVSAVANGNNRIDVSWSAVAGATEYHVYRGAAPGETTLLVGTVGATTFADTTVAAGITYYYIVKAATGSACESATSAEVSATATGVCSLGPDFAGLASVTSATGEACGLELTWAAAAAPCGGPVTYSVYRSATSGFTPGLANRIAAGLAATSFTDSSGLKQGTTYYYVVRATDEGNGVQETNTVERGGFPKSSRYLYGPESFEDVPEGEMGGWTAVSLNINPADWRGVQTCDAKSGVKILRFGGTSCTGRYNPNRHAMAMPPEIVVPAGASNVRLSFSHRWEFQALEDGGYLRISLDGTTFTYVGAAAIVSGAYNGTAAGLATWNGASGFVDTVVDLDAACNLVPGNTGGCAGKKVRVGLTAYTSPFNNYMGWFLDDVQVTADVPTACSIAPEPVQSFTARSTPGQNILEWRNPATGGYGSAVVRFRTDGVFPASVDEGTGVTCPDQVQALGVYNSCTHPGTGGRTYSYSLFVDDGHGVYSPRRTVAATPLAASGPHKWSYSTGAASLAPAGILPGAIGVGAVFAVSNDRILHAMNPTALGGTWPRTPPFDWEPLAMNAPAQHRPPVVPTAEGPRVFLASQDGYAYAVDARTGAPLWTSAQLGDVLQANPAGFFSSLRPGAPDILFVGTRNATSANKLYALDPASGEKLAEFDNGGGTSAIGIITGISVDYATGNVYFTSRASGGGSSHTLWCVHASRTAGATVASLTYAWSLPLGDSDGAPILRQNRLYVGTNAGEVKAVDPTTHQVVWTYTCNPLNGPIKGYVFPRLGSSPLQLFLATTDRVWAILDNGTTASLSWSVAVPKPSTPLYVSGTNHLLVGGGDGTLYQLDTDKNGKVSGSVSLGSSPLGSPGLDVTNDMLLVGSTAGLVHAVAFPLP
jgi:outer membrane protein assembly factor BamB